MLDTEEFAKFPQPRSAYQQGKPLLVMHDRGVQRQGAAVEEVVRETNGRLLRKAQPAYAPDLNPQERIRKWWRRVVPHHHESATLSQQVEAMREFCRYLAGVKKQVRRCCGFKAP